MGKHAKTIKAIFSAPVKANIAWKDIESLFIALGAQVTQGSGSRVRVFLNGVVAVFHRPHPQKEAGKDQVNSCKKRA